MPIWKNTTQIRGARSVRKKDSIMETNAVDAMEVGERSATFLVRVSKKPHEAWKGNVVWVSERCEQTFSTMQELFQIMDSTLQEESNNE